MGRTFTAQKSMSLGINHFLESPSTLNGSGLSLFLYCEEGSGVTCKSLKTLGIILNTLQNDYPGLVQPTVGKVFEGQQTVGTTL